MSLPFTRAAALLAEHDGLFIGENHTQTMAPEFLITHMAEFKAMGVTTLYIEWDHGYVASGALGHECQRSYYGPSTTLPKGIKPSNGHRSLDYNYVIEAARTAGIRVIGTEYDYSTAENYMMIYEPDYDKGEMVMTALGVQTQLSDAGMGARDEYAAKVIAATRDDGKYLVYGGSWHSRKGSAYPHLASDGLDTRLGIPSLDFKERGGFYRNEGIAGLLLRLSQMNNITESIVMNDRHGQATIKVTSGTHRYPERSEAAIAAIGTASVVAPDIAEIGETLRAAGACTAPPAGKLIRNDAEDLQHITNLVKAQYGASVYEQVGLVPTPAIREALREAVGR